ncbi:MAG TPA: fused MFS/spermidine synthase [Ktedonobacteraceae bacterium]|nr:fused MFS/spermidine synthase [Ktedonobacteraceae bacterium]
MSTTRDRQRSREEEAESGAVVATTGRTLQGWLLILLVFVAGAASLAVEMSASRLLAPYFGTSLFVWANLIGLILLYLTIGYYLGGRIADRYPRPDVLYMLTVVAAFLIGLIPFISRPILDWSLSAFVNVSISVFYGSLVSVILLFAVPMILLGCVSPFAIRLRVEQVGRSGSIAGQLYAISTAGSIVGTFLPVLVLIPDIGTYRTFFTFAVALLLTSIVGLIFSRSVTGTGSDGRNGNGKARRKGRFNKKLLSILLLIPMWLAMISIHGPIRPANGSNGGGTLIAERESAYNYIQVVRVGSQIQLVLNEGVGIHSIYDPNAILTGGPWDYFMVAPLFNNPPFSPQQVKRVAIIGLGAGTIAREMTAVYGPIPIDGVEIDGTIVQLARQYFDMNEPNLHVIVQDGRYFLRTTRQHYDEIAIDAYQQPYVPFQLTTVEFFREVRAHLTSTGVAVINAGRTDTDYRLVDTLAETMRAVFPDVYIIDTGYYENSLVIGTNQPTSMINFWANSRELTNHLLATVATYSIRLGHIREEQTAHVYYTDDRAPVEQLIDEMIFDAVQNGGN